MFINISTDQVYLSINDQEFFFNRDDVEKTFWPKLIELAKKYNFSDITVLNGPGGFTNLRVGALCLNMLNTLFEERFNIYDIDKVTLYKYMIQSKKFPDKGIIYIGQKKNIWDYDFEKDSYIQTQKNKILESDEHNLEEHFFDLVYDEEYFWKEITQKMPIISWDGNIITINYQQKLEKINLEKDLWIKPEKYIKANYFIQPILGKQWQ